MNAAAKTPAPAEVQWLAYPLFFLALYTLIVKFMNPLIFFAAGGAGGAPVMWDFWWAVHLFLGFCLLRRERFAWALALIVSVAEIAIIVIKFRIFLRSPVIDFWTLSWYVNKCFVLTYFVCLFAALFAPRVRKALRPW